MPSMVVHFSARADAGLRGVRRTRCLADSGLIDIPPPSLGAIFVGPLSGSQHPRRVSRGSLLPRRTERVPKCMVASVMVAVVLAVRRLIAHSALFAALFGVCLLLAALGTGLVGYRDA